MNKLLFILCFISCTLANAQEVQVEVLKKSTQSWNGDQLPNYKEGTPEVSILKFTIPPHTKMKWHKHLVINAGVLISGELSVVDEDNNQLDMKAGDSLIELVDKYHYGHNKGDQPAVIIVFYAGTQGVPITVLKNNAKAH